MSDLPNAIHKKLKRNDRYFLAFIAASWRQDRVAAWLFAPYAAWVAFASVLNGSIFALN